MVRRREQLTVGRRHVSVSNLDKVLSPGTRFTKAKVVDYYVKISKHLLPHLIKTGKNARAVRKNATTNPR